MHTYTFSLLDPRPIAVATEANDAVFAQGPVLGIEVTVPALAEQCTLGNIDPQHGTDADVHTAAIEAALQCPLPPKGSTLATIRADLDALGAMVVLSERALENEFSASFHERLQLIAEADTFANKGEWASKPLPSRETVATSGPLAAIGAAVSDFKVPIADRVHTLCTWLKTGEEPTQYRTQLEQEQEAIVAALESGAIQVSTKEGIAIVESAHRAGTSVGYTQAPVVIALNPAFRIRGGDPHRKFTICQFAPGHCDIKAALEELAAIEPGWGGSPTIGGSPQGVSSGLTVDEVFEIVSKHLVR